MILATLPSPFKDKTAAALYPHVTKLWDYHKNHPLTPDLFSPHSSQRVSWICKNGHRWDSKISHITDGHGCPFCCGNLPDEFTCLEHTHPDVAKQWHPNKNRPLTTSKVKKSSKKKVWWVCEQGHEYQMGIPSKVKGAKCPICKSLACRFPDTAKEWHPTKNGSLTAYDVGGRSGKKVWWKCKKGHIWSAAVNNRTALRGCNCPICKSLPVGDMDA
jgi:hypothetical protein